MEGRENPARLSLPDFMKQHLIRKPRMLHFPLFQLDIHPEAVNAHRDDGEQQPEKPFPEQLHRRAVEGQPVAVDDRVLRLPTVNHAVGPRQANAQRTDRDQQPKKRPADQLQQSAVETGFSADAGDVDVDSRVFHFSYLLIAEERNHGRCIPMFCRAQIQKRPDFYVIPVFSSSAFPIVPPEGRTVNEKPSKKGLPHLGQSLQL